MALIFPRLAQNFIKNGYFPTDDVTLSRILAALDIGAGKVRVLDPCCGEGVALAEVKHHLSECGAQVSAFGIEYDAERAWHAKNLLDRVIHGDVHDSLLSARAVGLLFLNPPYGDVVADKAGTGEQTKRERLEKIFYRRTAQWVQFGGVLVLIVPHYVLDSDFSAKIAGNFERVQVFMAPEQKFKQCVIFGVKKRAGSPDPATVRMLEAVGKGELPPELPEHWQDEPYLVPAAPEEFSFQVIRLDGPQLEAELSRLSSSTLWQQFPAIFSQGRQAHRRPLRQLSPWHLALALAAGQISGVVKSGDGRILLIRGETYKEKDTMVERTAREDGSIAETRILTDFFVPVIRGIDFTPGPGYGQIVTISSDPPKGEAAPVEAAPAEDSAGALGEVIYAYTRAQAIADGVLVDVSETAREAGFRFPVAMTSTVWEDCVAWSKEDSLRQTYQDEPGRLWDVLWMALQAAKNAGSGQEVPFSLCRVPRDDSSVEPIQVFLKMVIGPGDDAEPVITIMMPNED